MRGAETPLSQDEAKRHIAGECPTHSYDLVLDGTTIGSVVQNVLPGGREEGWRAKLLEDLPPEQRPSPFSAIEHAFDTLEAAKAWLGGADVAESVSNN